jgi:lysozyme
MPRIFRRSIRLTLAALAACSLAACSSVEEMGPARDYSAKLGDEVTKYPVHGIDVSKYQGNIDWPAAARSGVRFAYIKATEGGDRKDDRFDENWQGARAAGIPTGAYHFYYFCRPVEDQIAWFKTHVPPARDALPPVLDMEWNHLSPTCKKRPPAAQVQADMEVFLAEMRRFYGKSPIIYTTVDFHRDVLHSNALGNHAFWVRSVASHPAAKYADRSWTFWQYTATGSVPGVRGKVDRNVFAGSERQWQQFLAANSVVPASSTAVAQAVPAEPAEQPVAQATQGVDQSQDLAQADPIASLLATY